MLRFSTSVYKEILILIRDKAGIAILFIMPMVLVFVMTLIQDSTFRKLEETSLMVLFLDEDQDSLGMAIENGLMNSGFINIKKTCEGKLLDRETIIQLVTKGKYQIGIIIPAGATGTIRNKAEYLIEQAFSDVDSITEEGNLQFEPAKVILYFDPVIKNSFRESVRISLEKFIYSIESKITFDIFTDKISRYMPSDNNLKFDPTGSIIIEERYTKDKYNEMVPNSVQHNIPAWTVFAMFFIVIPLTGNIIKERESGSILRLKLMPGSDLIVMSAKILVYLLVCFIQFMLMLLVGIVFLPMLGLPVLELGPHILALIIIAIATALSATGYGIMLGTIATTHEQAASFGSVSIIILAAIGGIWVPIFVMPDVMQKISIISPLNWGLEGFYSIFLRGGGIMDILPYAGLLVGFCILTMFLAFQYQRFHKKF